MSRVESCSQEIKSVIAAIYAEYTRHYSKKPFIGRVAVRKRQAHWYLHSPNGSKALKERYRFSSSTSLLLMLYDGQFCLWR